MSALDELKEFDEWVADDFLKPKPDSNLEVYEVHLTHLIHHIASLPNPRQVHLKAALREIAKMLETTIRSELKAAAVQEAKQVLGE